MKAKYIFGAAALMLSMSVTSCVNDLDVSPIDPSTSMESNPEALFNKCYANFAVAGNGGANGDCDIDGLDGGTTGYWRQMFNANELTSDEAFCGWGDEGISDFCNNSWGASHPMLKGYYYRLFFGVTMCNFYLAECADYNETMTAEVRFLRAFHYLQLLDCFGKNVPFITEMSSEMAMPAEGNQVYDFIESELLEAEPLLLEPKARRYGQEGYGRADKAAAWLLLSRLYLNAGVYTGTPQWQKAADYAKKVITQSGRKLCTTPGSTFTTNEGDSRQWSAYQKLFMGDNGETDAADEAILALLQDGVTTTSWGTSLFAMASTFKADMNLVKGQTANGTSENWAGNRARRDLVAKFFDGDATAAPNGTCWEMVDAARDDRALLWGKDRNLDINNAGEFTDGFSVCKFVNHYSNNGAPHNGQFPDADMFIMRMAEAYLTAAEAITRQANATNLPAEALQYVNTLRARANAAEKNSFTLAELADEWSREFYFEGRRRSDLIRFGYYGGSNYTWQWKGGVFGGQSIPAFRNVFAIPDTDISANSNLTQNEGYK